ncbi:MAG: hypothetical protein K1X44_00335 [Alphaproteobacteria bacterium]|nr:hypothetical protein [Alphaproteobacteria bacterium]
MSIPYDYEIGKQICVKIAMGYRLDKLEEDDFPPLFQIMIWLLEEEGFYTLYEKALRIYSDIITGRVAELVKKSEKILEEDKSLTSSQRLSYNRMVIGSSKWLVKCLNLKKSVHRSQTLFKTQERRVDRIQHMVQNHSGFSDSANQIPTYIP